MMIYIIVLIEILSSFTFTISEEVIKIQFSSYTPANTPKDNNSGLQFLNDLEYSLITSNKIGIGTPSSTIPVFFDTDLYSTSVNTKCHSINSYSFYDHKKSSSFKNISNLNELYKTKMLTDVCTENFELSTYSNKNINAENIKFIIDYSGESLVNCLYIGLKITSLTYKSLHQEMIFLSQLHEKKVIKSNVWFLEFDQEKYTKNINNYEGIRSPKGNIIVGDYPHIVSPDKHFFPQLKKTYSVLSGGDINWKLKFNKVYYKYGTKITKIDDTLMKVNVNYHMNFGPNSYEEEICADFFNKFDNNVCKYYYVDADLVSYYCHKSEKFTEEHLKTFPTLYFTHNELNYTFELNYEDLFVEKDNIYYFLFYFQCGIVVMTDWIFGLPFLRKYNFVYDNDEKTIGFYNPNLQKYVAANGKSYFWEVFRIIFCSFIFLAVGIVLGRKIFYEIKNRKLKANELEDAYDYSSNFKEKNLLMNDSIEIPNKNNV